MFIEAATLEKILLVPIVALLGYRAFELFVFRRYAAWVWSNFAWVLIALCLAILGINTGHSFVGLVPAYIILLGMSLIQALFLGTAYSFLLALYVPLFLFCAGALKFLQFDKRGQLWNARARAIDLYLKGDADAAKMLINRWNEDSLPDEGMLVGNHIVAFSGARIVDNIEDMLKEGQKIKQMCSRYSWHVGCTVARALSEKGQIDKAMASLEYIGPGPALGPIRLQLLERSVALQAEDWAMRGLVEKPDQLQLDLYLPTFYALLGLGEDLDAILAKLEARYKVYPAETRELFIGICLAVAGNKEEAREHLNKTVSLCQEQLDRNAEKAWPARISMSRAQRWLSILEQPGGIPGGDELVAARTRFTKVISSWRAGKPVRKVTDEDAQLLAAKPDRVDRLIAGTGLFDKGRDFLFVQIVLSIVAVGSVVWIAAEEGNDKVKSSDPFTHAAQCMRFHGGMLDNDRVLKINFGFAKNPDDEMISAADEAVRKGPERAETYYLRGCAYFSAEKPNLDQAIEDFSAAIKRAPRWANAYYRLGRCLERQGKSYLAQAEFKRALALVPTDSATLHHLELCSSPKVRSNSIESR